MPWTATNAGIVTSSLGTRSSSGEAPQSNLAPAAAVAEAYTHERRGDEFLQPIIFSHANEQRVRDGDVVIWFNFRADRARQLSEAFSDERVLTASRPARLRPRCISSR